MKMLLIMLLLCSTSLEAKKIGLASDDKKPVFHKFSVSTLYLHISDPKWENVWWRRNFVPEYQIGYDRYSLKGRIFSLGQLAGPDEDYGMVFFPTETKTDGRKGIKDNSVIRYAHLNFDLLASLALVNNNRHKLQIGLGGAYRKGYEILVLFEYPPDPDYPWEFHWESKRVLRNQWGLGGEVSYSLKFLKYLVASAQAGYRTYLNGPGVFTGGVGLGVQFNHVLRPL